MYLDLYIFDIRCLKKERLETQASLYLANVDSTVLNRNLISHEFLFLQTMVYPESRLIEAC